MTQFYVGYTATGAYEGGVGSRIKDVEAFEAALREAVEAFDFSEANPGVKTEGQGFIRLDHAVGTVAAGVGKRMDDPSAYVLRPWRGRVGAFLKREHAVEAETLAVVVYTGPAFLKALQNPDTPPNVAAAEEQRFKASGATHAVVAVLAGAGPEALSPDRLVSNLAGGNADALKWSADEIRAKAVEAVAYADEWEVVSD